MRMWGEFCHLIQVQKFTLKTDFIALNRLLKAIGWAETGGHAHELIDTSMISVDGVIELQRRKKIKAGMTVCLNGACVLVEGSEMSLNLETT